MIEIERDLELRVDELIERETNPRIHTKSGIASLAARIKSIGWTVPVIVDENNVLISGHKRKLAAELLELERVPAARIIGLSESQKVAEVISDNQQTLSSAWDYIVLGEQLQQIDTAPDVNLYELGFQQYELNNFMGGGDGGSENSPEKNWGGMPEFDNPEAFGIEQTIKVNFMSTEDREEFAKLVGQAITKDTKYIYFPKQAWLSTDHMACEDESPS